MKENESIFESEEGGDHVRLMFGACSCGRTHDGFKAEDVTDQAPGKNAPHATTLRLKFSDDAYNAVRPR